MSIQDIETSKKTNDGKDSKDNFIALNFKKHYIQSPEGLIQTETIEVQMAPEIKQIVNAALFKASKKSIKIDRSRRILQDLEKTGGVFSVCPNHRSAMTNG